MQIINYFESDKSNELIEKIEACDWGAAKFLAELLREDRFFEMLGGEGDLYILMDGKSLVSYLTLTKQDVVRDESMYPWIGFVYTVPEYRGHRYCEKLISYAEDVARSKGYKKVYIATDHIGLYEKFGYEYLENRIGYWGDDNRVLFKTLTDNKEKTMNIKTERLNITEFTLDMAEAVHLNSLDEDNRRFVPDEVFETVEDARDTVEFLMSVYESGDGPLVYPVLLHDNTYIGYVQAVPFEEGKWEIGYHIGSLYTKKGYATEAVRAFLPVIMKKLGVTEMTGVCLAENIGSVKVMEKAGFIKQFEGIGNYQGEDREICRFVYALGVETQC
ncbi:MAG: GNAT family N-acetyltransferase [Ruminococcus sp.]|nr:GNAT family N-acetyltransferase [Ruminococcus sp.]